MSAPPPSAQYNGIYLMLTTPTSSYVPTPAEPRPSAPNPPTSTSQPQGKMKLIKRRQPVAETSLPSQRFLIPVYYRNKPITALLDSGADACAISKSWANRHPELKRKTSSQELIAAFGSSLRNPDIIEIPMSKTLSGETSPFPVS